MNNSMNNHIAPKCGKECGGASLLLVATAWIGAALLAVLIHRTRADLARVALRAEADKAVASGAAVQARAADLVAAGNLLTLILHGTSAAVVLGGGATSIALITTGSVPAGIDTLAQSVDLAGDLLVAHADLRRGLDKLIFEALPAVVPAAVATVGGVAAHVPVDPAVSDNARVPIGVRDDVACTPDAALPERRPFGLDLAPGGLLARPENLAAVAAPNRSVTGQGDAGAALAGAYAERYGQIVSPGPRREPSQHGLCELRAAAPAVWQREVDRAVQARLDLPKAAARWPDDEGWRSTWSEWRRRHTNAPPSASGLFPTEALAADPAELRRRIDALRDHGQSLTCEEIEAQLLAIDEARPSSAARLPTPSEFAEAVARFDGSDVPEAVRRDSAIRAWIQSALCVVARAAGAASWPHPWRMGAEWNKVGTGVVSIHDASVALAQAGPRHPKYRPGDLPLLPGFRAVPIPTTIQTRLWPSSAGRWIHEVLVH